MLQFVDRKKTPPSYLEKVTLYLHPQGGVVIMVGNQTFHTTPDEAEQFIKSRLVHQAQYSTLFGIGDGSAHE